MVHYHEIGLKGHNRSTFEMRLLKNLEALLTDFDIVTIHRISGRLCVFLREGTDWETEKRCAEFIRKVPGVARVSSGYKCERDLKQMEEAALAAMADVDDFTSFKVQARRNHTDFEVGSMDMNRIIGAALCEAHPEKKVQMKNPDVVVGVEVVQNAAYVYARSVRGVGGLPVGSSARWPACFQAASTPRWPRGAWRAAAPCASASIFRAVRKRPTPASTWSTISRTCWRRPVALHACT